MANFEMINARAETLLVSPAYKNLVSRKRSIIPADGFFEFMWTFFCVQGLRDRNEIAKRLPLGSMAMNLSFSFDKSLILF